MFFIGSISIIFLWIGSIIGIAILCKNIWPHQKELSRKVVHIGTGPIIPIALGVNIHKEQALFVASIITILLCLNHRFKFIEAVENIKRKSFGTIAYALSISILIAFYWNKNPNAIVAGVLVMALGDGFAGLIGSRINSFTWLIFGQKKSLYGTLTMLLVSIISLYTINLLNGYPISTQEVFIIGIIGVICEQIGQLGIDNLTVPLLVALSWSIFTSN